MYRFFSRCQNLFLRVIKNNFFITGFQRGKTTGFAADALAAVVAGLYRRCREPIFNFLGYIAPALPLVSTRPRFQAKARSLPQAFPLLKFFATNVLHYCRARQLTLSRSDIIDTLSAWGRRHHRKKAPAGAFVFCLAEHWRGRLIDKQTIALDLDGQTAVAVAPDAFGHYGFHRQGLLIQQH